jgi:hypothetical protein
MPDTASTEADAEPNRRNVNSCAALRLHNRQPRKGRCRASRAYSPGVLTSASTCSSAAAASSAAACASQPAGLAIEAPGFVAVAYPPAQLKLSRTALPTVSNRRRQSWGARPTPPSCWWRCIVLRESAADPRRKALSGRNGTLPRRGDLPGVARPLRPTRPHLAVAIPSAWLIPVRNSSHRTYSGSSRLASGRKVTKVSDASEFQNRINQLRSELQGKVSEFQSRMSEVQSKLSELPSKMGAHAEERVASIFEDIDPEASPHAYSVKAAGNTVLDLIDGLVHAVAAIEKDLAAREGGG